MRDIVLDRYVKELLSENIEEEKFRKYIELFSKFLGYVNPDYKYNGTYLSQYVDDFQNVHRRLNEKREKYIKIYGGLTELLPNFELVIDRVYYEEYPIPAKDEIRYIGLDKDKIMSDSIEVQITINQKKDQYIFCKEYKDTEDELSERVCNDIENFMDIKKGENNDTA